MTTYTYQQLVNNPALAVAFDPLADVLDLQAVVTEVTVTELASSVLFTHPDYGELELNFNIRQIVDRDWEDDNIISESGVLWIGNNLADQTGDDGAFLFKGVFTGGPFHFMGLGGDDSHEGSTSSDLLYGGDGNDTLLGATGNDTIYGGQGADFIDGNEGVNLLYGGLDNDTIRNWKGTGTIYGGDGFDRLRSSGGVIYGNAHDDWMDSGGLVIAYGNTGNDTIYGGGRDTVYGGQGLDQIFGYNNVMAYGNMGADTIIARTGRDTIYGGQGGDLIAAGPGPDLIYGNQGHDTMSGGAGIDIFILTPSDGTDTDTIVDLETTDALRFKNVGLAAVVPHGANSAILLGSGDAVLVLNRTVDQVLSAIEVGKADRIFVGTDAPDTMVSGAGNDLIEGLMGPDLIYGGEGGDTINAGTGADTVFGEGGADTISDAYVAIGGDGADLIIDATFARGGNGPDTLKSSVLAYPESLYGDGGNDVIWAMNDLTADPYISRSSPSVFSSVAYIDGQFVTVDSTNLAPAMILDGGTGNDTIVSNGDIHDGNLIIGGPGADSIWAGAGIATVVGGPGDDTIISAVGNTMIATGTGTDILYLNSITATRHTMISDFNPAHDRLNLDTAFDRLEEVVGREGTLDRSSVMIMTDTAAGNTVITFDLDPLYAMSINYAGDTVITVTGVTSAALADAIWLGAY